MKAFLALLLISSSLAYTCPKDDKHCNECLNQNICKTCVKGFFQDGKGCSQTISKAIDRCSSYVNDKECATCEKGYFLSNDKTCVQCKIVGCDECKLDENLTEICEVCSKGLTTGLSCESETSCDNVNCESCADMQSKREKFCKRCANNFAIDVQHGFKCISAPANCLQAESTGVCQKCFPNFALNEKYECVEDKTPGPGPTPDPDTGSNWKKILLIILGILLLLLVAGLIYYFVTKKRTEDTAIVPFVQQ